MCAGKKENRFEKYNKQATTSGKMVWICLQKDMQHLLRISPEQNYFKLNVFTYGALLTLTTTCLKTLKIKRKYMHLEKFKDLKFWTLTFPFTSLNFSSDIHSMTETLAGLSQ